MADTLFAQLLADVGQLIGIPQLAASDDQACQLVFDGRHQVHIIDVPTRGHVLVSCAVGATNITSDQALEAARCNFMQAANGIIACASPRDGRLLLQFGRPRNEVSANDLLTAIEALLQQVEAWEVKHSRASLPASKPLTDAKFLMRSV